MGAGKQSWENIRLVPMSGMTFPAEAGIAGEARRLT